MSDETPRLHLAQLVSLQELNAVTWNEALAQLDAMADLLLLGQYVNTPPANPAAGDAYLIGDAPTGAWSGYAHRIASCLDGAWRFYVPFNGLRAYVATTGAFIVYVNGAWTDWNSLISAAETSIAAAATCDLGAAGSLFVQITGNGTITSFGTAANKLRFVRFAQQVTLAHHATSLILLGGANRTTAAGDVGLYASDASGNWRERSYFRANGGVVAPAQAMEDVLTAVPQLAVDLNGNEQTGLTPGAFNKVAFTHVLKDTNGWWDAANKRYTPQRPGSYLVVLSVYGGGSGMTTGISASVRKNGVGVASGQFNDGLVGATIVYGMVNYVVDVNGTTDYIEGWAWAPPGLTSFTGNSIGTRMQIVRIG